MAKLSKAQEKAMGIIRNGVEYNHSVDTFEKYLASQLKYAKDAKDVEYYTKKATRYWESYGASIIEDSKNNATLVRGSIKTETLAVLARLGYIKILKTKGGMETIQLL